MSGLQTKIVFKQSFKYFKNEKVNFIKVILKLECLFYQNIYIYIISSYFIFVEPCDSNKSIKRSKKKKLAIYIVEKYFSKQNE